jgi:anti-sigma regulatory factor (Ser/Thr protein kinase)
MVPPFSITCTTRPSSLALLHESIDKRLAPLGEGQEWLADVHIIVDEMASNIEKYAYPSGEGSYVLNVKTLDAAVELVFEDEGVVFDPLAVHEMPLQGETDRPVGRLGLLLVRSLAERMEYNREAGRNVTKIVLALAGKEIIA